MHEVEHHQTRQQAVAPPDPLREAYAALAAARADAEGYRQRCKDLESELAALAADARRLVVLDEATAMLAEYSRDVARMAEFVHASQGYARRVQDLESSTSWRVTAPFRRITALFRRHRA